jgi:methylenetetrahydrofolate dehydrogenase (NADP+)/methenyltetrahydrofolate cyclohydrolase
VPAKIIDGKALAGDLCARLRAARAARAVRLLSLEVGDNPAADRYVRNQQRAADAVGIELLQQRLPADVSQSALIELIAAHNADPHVTGVIVQRPLPPGVEARAVQAAISPDKDVEGMNPANMGAILYSEPLLAPCTALAAQHIVRHVARDLRGLEAVVVGHSEIVGKPVAILLLHHLATVTVCHVGTRQLSAHTLRADVLIVAVGKPGLVHGDMIKPGATVIDIGINQLPDGGICGDVDFASALPVAGAITPVPGGVGPVTVMMLMRNTLRAAGIEGV